VEHSAAIQLLLLTLLVSISFILPHTARSLSDLFSSSSFKLILPVAGGIAALAAALAARRGEPAACFEAHVSSMAPPEAVLADATRLSMALTALSKTSRIEVSYSNGVYKIKVYGTKLDQDKLQSIIDLYLIATTIEPCQEEGRCAEAVFDDAADVITQCKGLHPLVIMFKHYELKKLQGLTIIDISESISKVSKLQRLMTQAPGVIKGENYCLVLLDPVELSDDELELIRSYISRLALQNGGEVKKCIRAVNAVEAQPK